MTITKPLKHEDHMTNSMLDKAARAVYDLEYGGVSFTCEEMVRAILTAIRDLRAEDQPIVDAMREAALAGSHDFLYDRAWAAAIDAILKEGT